MDSCECLPGVADALLGRRKLHEKARGTFQDTSFPFVRSYMPASSAISPRYVRVHLAQVRVSLQGQLLLSSAKADKCAFC